MELSESIRITATEYDKQLLSLIAKQDGDPSMSSIIRRLIRDEANRRGIKVATEEATETVAANE